MEKFEGTGISNDKNGEAVLHIKGEVICGWSCPAEKVDLAPIILAAFDIGRKTRSKEIMRLLNDK